MSEETNEVKPIKVEIYKPEAVITIQLPVGYVARFNQMLLEFFPFKDEQHLKDTLKKVADSQDDPDEFVYNVRTILSFLVLVEEEARKQGHLKYVEYDPVTETTTDVSED
jgi:flagellar biosynthesis component FlhA